MYKACLYLIAVVVSAYLKVSEWEAEGAAASQNYSLLLLVGSVVAAILLILVVVLFLVGTGKHKRKQRVEGSVDHSTMFEREHSDQADEENTAFREDDTVSRVRW